MIAFPDSTASAFAERHGTGATAPSTTFADVHVSPFISSTTEASATGQSCDSLWSTTYVALFALPFPSDRCVTISLFASTFSLRTLSLGSAKNLSSGISRAPDGPATRTVAAKAISAGATLDPWTATQGPSLAKIAWYSFSPSRAGQVLELPRLAQANRSWLKYQQGGRVQTFPPIVAMLRICGVATLSIAWAIAGYCLARAGFSSSAESVTPAPIRSPPLTTSILSKPLIAFRLTSTSGSTTRSFIRLSRVVPPASGSAPGPRALTASSSLFALL